MGSLGAETNSPAALSYVMGAADDAGLVSLVKKGDVDAFEQLVSRHQKRMLNVAFRLTNDYDDACEMEHNSIRHKLSDFLDNAVSATGKAEIEAHLKSCTICSEALEELRKTVGQVRRIEEV